MLAFLPMLMPEIEKLLDHSHPEVRAAAEAAKKSLEDSAREYEEANAAAPTIEQAKSRELAERAKSTVTKSPNKCEAASPHTPFANSAVAARVEKALAETDKLLDEEVCASPRMVSSYLCPGSTTGDSFRLGLECSASDSMLPSIMCRCGPLEPAQFCLACTGVRVCSTPYRRHRLRGHQFGQQTRRDSRDSGRERARDLDPCALRQTGAYAPTPHRRVASL